MKRRSFLGGLIGAVVGGPAAIKASEEFEKKPEVLSYPPLDSPDINTIPCSGFITTCSGGAFRSSSGNITFSSSLFGPNEGCNTKL